MSVNEIRLNVREWIAALGNRTGLRHPVAAALENAEPFHPSPDYRIPYALSNDYWLYQRRLETIPDPPASPSWATR